MDYLLNSPMVNAFNTVPKRTLIEKNSVCLSQATTIDINVVDGIRWIVVGDPGSGKSYALGIMMNQFKNCWMFDPTGKFKDTILEQGVEDKWNFLELTPKKRKTAFKMNVADLNSRILDSLFTRSEDTQKKRVQRQAIEHFVDQPDNTYDDWEKMCEENKLQTIFTDMRWILSENDSAPPLLESSKGKSVIDCEGVSIRNPAVGVVLQSLIGIRSNLPKSFLLDASNFICVALDEAQDYARYQTPSGAAFSDLSLQARKYGIGEILVGSAYDSIHPDCRAKSNLKFIFSSPGITEKYRREGIDILPTDWSKLGKYECFIYSDDGSYRGAVGNHTCQPNLYYRSKRKLNKVPEEIIRENNTEFELNNSLFL